METVQTHQFYTEAVQRLRAAGVESAENDATILIQSCLEKPRYLWEKQLTEQQVTQLENLLQRREQREPLAYILGKMWFYGLELQVRPGVFCVRPETELLVETALKWARQQQLSSGRALDLCSGSGAIALSLAAQLPHWQVRGVELSDGALETARANAAQLGLTVDFQAGDATAYQPEWEQRYQLVVSNPPYVPPRELPAETHYEPAAAFWGGGADGMQIPAQIIRRAYQYLLPGGLLILEHDDSQGAATQAVARACGFVQVRTQADLNGIDRFLVATKPSAKPWENTIMEIIDCTNAAQPLSEAQLAAVTQAIQANQPIVFPTDTVYGIGGNPASKEAVGAVLAAKGRGRQMPPPVLLANPQQVELVAKAVPAVAYRLMEAFWPGPLTLILPTGDGVKYDLGDLPDTIAVRMPDHPVALQILEKTGPLAVTSANLTGEEPATDCAQAAAYFGNQVALYFDGGATGGNVPSTIVSCVGEVEILREGKLLAAEIFEVVGRTTVLENPAAPENPAVPENFGVAGA